MRMCRILKIKLPSLGDVAGNLKMSGLEERVVFATCLKPTLIGTGMKNFDYNLGGYRLEETE